MNWEAAHLSFVIYLFQSVFFNRSDFDQGVCAHVLYEIF